MEKPYDAVNLKDLKTGMNLSHDQKKHPKRQSWSTFGALGSQIDAQKSPA